MKFEKVTNAHLETIFSWLSEPHVMEFWDNTQAHKDDIVNFAEGRKTPSSISAYGTNRTLTFPCQS